MTKADLRRLVRILELDSVVVVPIAGAHDEYEFEMSADEGALSLALTTISLRLVLLRHTISSYSCNQLKNFPNTRFLISL